MKRGLVYILLMTIVGCSSNPESEPVDEAPVPIRLSYRKITLDKPDTVRKIKIIAGNGSYTLVFPKQISVGSNNKAGYSESILTLYIDESDNIVVERKLLDDQWVSGVFMIKDIKGERMLFIVEWYDEPVGGPLVNFDELESRLLYSEDFWQE